MIIQLGLSCIVIYLTLLCLEHIFFKDVEIPVHWQKIGALAYIISFIGSVLFTLVVIWAYV